MLNSNNMQMIWIGCCTGESNSLYILGNQGSPAFFAAQTYAEINQAVPTFEWLDKAYEAHELEMIWLKSEPQF